jgi:acyl-CoA hydrolase
MSPATHTLAEAVAAVRPVDHLGFPLGPGQPGAFLHGLGERDDWEDLTLYGALLVDLYAVFTKPGVHYVSGFFGPAERFLRDAGADVQFVPADFRRFGPALRFQAPRVMCTAAAMPDADGYMSLSLHAGAHSGELRRCGADPDRLLVVEVSPNFPRTYGIEPQYNHAIHLDEADMVIESDRSPFVLAEPDPTEAERAIARQVADFIPESATLQTGIGGIPSMVARLLAESDKGDFGVHSEMFTTGLMKLHEAGKVTNRSKGIYEGMSISTFAAGEAELYQWIDEQRDVRFLPVELVNDPAVIAANRRFVSINGALAVDLAGQVTADTLGGRQFSGIGGHEDFLAGAGLELEDRSLVCLPSIAVIDGRPVSKIVDQFSRGTIVTTPRHQVDVVVTEHGLAELRGLTIRQRARALAEISDPSVRDELRAAAEEWPVD